MSTRSLTRQPKRLQRIFAASAATLISVASLTFLAVQPAAAEANGLLDVRALSVSCGFTNVPTEPNNQCADVPERWYPSETANSQAILTGTENPAVCGTAVTAPAANYGAASVSVESLTCNGRTHATNNLLGSIFSGTDAYGHPNIPASTLPWPAANSQICTVDNAQVTDIGAASTCGVGAASRSSAEWYIMEGFVSLPAVPSGQITLQASNIGQDGTARAEYLAFMASSDDTFENLAFVGEAQTAFQIDTELNVPVDVSTDVGNVCASETRAIRLYMQDNIDGSSATLRWDIGDGFAPIPAEYLGNNNDLAEECLPPVAVDNAGTTTPGVAVDIDVLGDDTPGSAPLDPTTVRFVDPTTGEPVTTVVVPGEGTWTVDPATGLVTFTPIAGFTGTTTALPYVVQDENGLTARANITVTVNAPPVAVDNAGTTTPGVAVDIDVLGDDTPGSAPLDPTTVRFVDPTTGEPVTTVVVPGEGTWTVDPATGLVTFTPIAGFTGTTTALPYVVQDENGLTARANITVTVNAPPVVTAPTVPAPAVPAPEVPTVSENPAPTAELANTGASPTLLIVGEALMLLLVGLAIVASRKRTQ